MRLLAIVKDIEKAIAGYSQGDRKGDCWLRIFFDMFKKDFGKVGK
jgi:hypothetical protein